MAKLSSTSKNIKAKLAKKAGITQAEAGDFIESFLELVSENLLKENKIHLQEFGVFEVHNWKAQEIFNISKKAKEQREIKTISFKPSVKLKEKITR